MRDYVAPKLDVLQVLVQEEPGGAQVLARVLDEEFRNRGIRTDCIALYHKRHMPGYSPLRCLASSRPGPLGTLRIGLSLLRLFRSTSPRQVLLHSPYAIALCAPLARLAGVKRRTALHHAPEVLQPRGVRWINKVWRLSGMYTCQVFPGAAAHEAYGAKRSCPTFAIPNRIALPPSQRDRSRCLQDVGIAAHRWIVLTVGRLAPEKNHQLLAGLADRFAEQADFVLIGDGELRAQFEREACIRPNFHLLGEMDRGRVSDWLAACDVFAFPSLCEGLSLSLLEARAAGCRIVASDIASNREALERYGNASFASPDDIDGWENLVRGALVDREHCEGIRATPSDDMEQMIESYINALQLDTDEELLARRGPIPKAAGPQFQL